MSFKEGAEIATIQMGQSVISMLEGELAGVQARSKQTFQVNPPEAG